MAQTFISHVEEDSSLALELSTGLEEAGYTTWCYERDSVPGCSYLLQTGAAIDEADALILLISERSLGSNQVTSEVVRAHETNTPIVPLRLDVSHELFQRRQPEWRQAIGAAASLQLDRANVLGSLDRILRGLRALGVMPGGTPGKAGVSGGPAAQEVPAAADGHPGEAGGTPEARQRAGTPDATGAEVYLSYPRGSADVARLLQGRLRKEGIRSFICDDALLRHGASDYGSAIDRALDSASLLVVVATGSGQLESGWPAYEWRSFLNEIHSGRKPGGRILILTAGIPVAQLPSALRIYQAVACDPTSPGESLDGLVARVRGLLPGREEVP